MGSKQDSDTLVVQALKDECKSVGVLAISSDAAKALKHSALGEYGRKVKTPKGIGRGPATKLVGALWFNPKITRRTFTLGL